MSETMLLSFLYAEWLQGIKVTLLIVLEMIMLLQQLIMNNKNYSRGKEVLKIGG